MLFNTLGNKNHPAILFFHAMGVVGESSLAVVDHLKDHYYCIFPTATLYCRGQKYLSKDDETKQIESFLANQNIQELALVVASSIGADLAMNFITTTKVKIDHVFFDGGQFAQIKFVYRRIASLFIYLAIKSLYWTKAKTLKYILWCDDDNIKTYFIKAAKNLKYTNLVRQLDCSLKNEAFPKIDQELEKKTYFEFGNLEDHFKYRDNVIKAYPNAHYPIFKECNHMQYQIRDPKGFADLLDHLIKYDELMPLNAPFHYE